MQGPTLAADGVVLDALPLELITARYVSWLNDPVVMGATEAGGQVHTLDSTRAYIAKQNASSDVLFWRIVQEGSHIGNLRASGLSSPHKRCAIALIIGEAGARGRGLGTTAISLATEHLFSLGIHKVTAGMYASNPASQRAFLKAGYVTEAVLREHFVHDGRHVDGLLVAKLAAPT